MKTKLAKQIRAAQSAAHKEKDNSRTQFDPCF